MSLTPAELPREGLLKRIRFGCLSQRLEFRGRQQGPDIVFLTDTSRGWHGQVEPLVSRQKQTC